MDSIERELATIERLLQTNQILDEAAERIDGESRESIRSSISSAVDQGANVITIAATADDPDRAAAIANGVAESFLDTRREAERDRLRDAQAALRTELNRLRGSGGSSEEIAVIQQRLSELSVSEASVGSELELAQAAEPPTAPYAPRPIRNGVLAFFAAIFVAVIAALARDRLVPRVAGPRELSRLFDAPVIAAVPHVRRRLGRRARVLGAVVNEAYQTLQASVRFALPPDEQRLILVTSALEGEGKSSVAAGLARSLARGGMKTLVVSADLRFPTLHEQFETTRAPGLSELLREASQSPERLRAQFESIVRSSIPAGGGNLHVLPSGERPSNPGDLLLGKAAEELFDMIGELDYAYVIVDGPPLLGIADSHTLAQRADGVAVVARLSRLTFDDVIESRDVLDRLSANVLGLVVVGARRTSSYAYSSSGVAEEDEVEGEIFA